MTGSRVFAALIALSAVADPGSTGGTDDCDIAPVIATAAADRHGASSPALPQGWFRNSQRGPSPGYRMQVDGCSRHRLQKLAANALPVEVVAEPLTGAPRRSTTGKTATAGAPQTAGDLFVFSPHNGVVAGPWNATATSNPNGPSDYTALRFTTSQVAKQLPFQIDAIWFELDNYFVWSKNWQFQVATEDPARPFYPDLAAGVVSGPTTFDAGTYYAKGTNPTPSTLLEAKVDLPDADYPATARFAIDDKSQDDTFTRADGPLMPLPTPLDWLECQLGTGCGATQYLKIMSQKVVNTGLDTVFAWRAPDTTTAPAASRYVINQIEPNVGFNPDQDVRLTADFNLTSGLRAGVFFRAAYLGDLLQYYAVFADKTDNTVKLTSTDGFYATTVLKTAPLVGNSGKLVVEVSGYNPIVVNVKIGAVPAFTHTITTGDLWQGDPLQGNILGIIFPNDPGLGGGETIDNFKVNRNADLFAVAKMPAGETAFLWYANQPEARQFYAGFTTTDAGATWRDWPIPAGLDCTGMVNPMVALQVKDSAAGGGSSCYQVNNTITSIYLPCCTCTTYSFNCPYTSNNTLDECASPPTPSGSRPRYDTSSPIVLEFGFSNERSPDSKGKFLIAAQICDDSLPCVNGLCTQGVDCWILGGRQGPFSLSPFTVPGHNSSTKQDNFPVDSHPDGAYQFRINPVPAIQYTPPRDGNYHIYVTEFYDLDLVGGIDDPNPDEYPFNAFVQRPFVVGGAPCTTKAYNFRKNSFLLLKNDTVSPCPTPFPATMRATWRSQTLPADTATVFNLHELVGSAGLAQIANPYPPASVLPPQLTGYSPACLATTATSGINFYALFEADNCTNISMRDP